MRILQALGNIHYQVQYLSFYFKILNKNVKYVKNYLHNYFKRREFQYFIQIKKNMDIQKSYQEDLKIKIKTFNHDYYVMQLPKNHQKVQFERKLPFYKNKLDFRGQSIQFAPVGRIYGTNEFGQKCCCHIHGYFPSFYIKLDEYSQYMKNEANKIIFLDIVQNLYQEAYNIRKPIVFNGQIQQKMDFYGFHNKKQLFLKIYLYNPGDTLRMRELMGSRMIQNKFFQCYQAHINYFMQMFTDLNILGIHEMNICSFSFRRNLPLMKMLRKFQPKLHNGLMKNGWNVQQLQLTNPQHFNGLHKTSTCYLQFDFPFQSILNQFQQNHDIWSDNQQDSFDSCSEMERVKDENTMLQITVKVTTALNEIWRDEVKRREKFGIKQKPYSFIDYSNNIQNTIRILKKQQIMKDESQELCEKKQRKVSKDALWISFLNKGSNLEDLKKMIKSYQQKQFFAQKNELNVCGLGNYNDQLQKQKQELIGKVRSRWDFYQTRKNNIINQIVRGDRDQLPQWSDDDKKQESEEEQQIDDQQDVKNNQNLNLNKSNLNLKSQNFKNKITQKGPKVEKQSFLFGKKGDDKSKKEECKQKKTEEFEKSINPFEVMMRKQTNTVKYRNNYTVKEFKVRDEGIFKKCIKCRNNQQLCWCDYKKTDFLQLEINKKTREKLGNQDMKMRKHERNDKAKSNKEMQISSQQMSQQEIGQACTTLYKYGQQPPTYQDIKTQQIQPQHQRPYFSDFSDLLLQYNKTQLIPDLKTAQNIDRHVAYPKDCDRRPITIKNNLKLPYFFIVFQTPQRQNFLIKDYLLKYDEKPPTFQDIKKQLNPPKQKLQKRESRLSLAKFQDTFVSDLILMKYEIYACVSDKSKFYSDPQSDKINAIFFQLSNYQNYYKNIRCFIFIQGLFKENQIDFDAFDQVFMVKDQISILKLWISIVIRVDIDIFICYDQQKRGIYYLLVRSIQYGIDLTQAISRSGSLQQCIQYINFNEFVCLKETNLKKQFLTYGNLQNQMQEESNPKTLQATKAYMNLIKQKIHERKNRAPELRKKYSFNIDIKGRVNINLNRICEQQLKLRSYTIQNVAKNMFRSQFCQFTDKYLNSLVQSNIQSNKKFVQNYYLQKIQLLQLITHQLNIIGGILEKSKIYGADFLSMMERGSQFKIQAVMCRVTKKRNFLTLSATRNQVANQSILQCRPLVIQPPKEFYQEPVLLFDFQSLYPSVMIAYNICYSTCLGSIKQVFKQGKLKKVGVSQYLSIDMQQIAKIIDHEDTEIINKLLSQKIFITPNKVAFVKKNIKQGLIPQILLQFLMTRIMIKKSMKLYKKQSIMHLLKQRQIALKLFMNVLYGYTGASFTGRMPCSQIADSVVQISKYCLKQSIDFLNNHERFKGKVIYGDTDSIFFHLPGAKVSQCFEIGKQLALQITKLFPYPMQMKFQKVYESLVLVSKKRYYGKSFESHDSSPKYQGKGLQCVRRDGIEETGNLMREMIDKLIDQKDLSQVKKIFVEEYESMKKKEVLQNNLCLAKEVKFLKYSQKSMPAHGHAAKRFEMIDPIMLPKYGQRTKYVVTQSYKNTIKQKSIPLFEYLYLSDNKKQLDYEYYINKQIIPPLHRVFVSLTNLQKFLYKNISRNQSTINKKQSWQQNVKIKSTNEKNFKQQIQQINNKCSQICRKCIGSDHIQVNDSQCIELNCKILYLKKKIRKIKHDQDNGKEKEKGLKQFMIGKRNSNNEISNIVEEKQNYNQLQAIVQE